MAKIYKPFHPDHEFLGRTVLNLQTALGTGRVQDIFVKHGLGEVDPDAWYPAQLWFDAINEIADDQSSTMDFVGLGMKSVENAVVPAETPAIPVSTFLEGSARTYPLHNRGTDIGSVQGVVVNDHHVKMVLRMPHPDDFWYGVYYSFISQLLSERTSFIVYYDQEIPRRDQGGEVTIIHIEWDTTKTDPSFEDIR